MGLLSLFAASVVAATAVAGPDVKEAAKEIVGAWKLEYTTPDFERRTPMVIVGRQHEELVAWYLGGNGIENFTKVKLQGKSLHLTIVPKEFGGLMAAELEAQLTEKGACAGKISFANPGGESGTLDFSGKRVALETLDDVSKWDLKFVTPDGIERCPLITVARHRDRLHAWYSSEDFELPASKFTLEGDKAIMEVTAKTDEGRKIDVTFHGTVEGDRVRGTAEWKMRDDSGEFFFTGRRRP